MLVICHHLLCRRQLNLVPAHTDRNGMLGSFTCKGEEMMKHALPSQSKGLHPSTLLCVCAKSDCPSPFISILSSPHSSSTSSSVSLLYLHPPVFPSFCVCPPVCLSADASWFSAAAVCRACQTSSQKANQSSITTRLSSFSPLCSCNTIAHPS